MIEKFQALCVEWEIVRVFIVEEMNRMCVQLKAERL
jgi:hypothetical protein